MANIAKGNYYLSLQGHEEKVLIMYNSLGTDIRRKNTNIGIKAKDNKK